MATIAEWMLLGAVMTLVYTYAGFPLLVATVGALRGRPVRRAPITPSASLIIAAYNEEEEIGGRLENALGMDYPREQLEILVASDGSTDGTDRVVADFASRGVRALSLPRQGKIHALDRAVRVTTGRILVFSDANTWCEPQALRALVSNFADPQVGGVAGHTAYRVAHGSESSSRGEHAYWRYDTLLKTLESRTGSIVSAHGGLYAIRRELYQTSPDSSSTDDFAISTAVIDQGYRLVFEPEARAFETAVPHAHREFWRRVRLMTRGLRGVVMRRRLLNPLRTGFYAFVLLSHKVVRRLAFVPLVAIAVSTAMLWPGAGAAVQALALAQVAFYGAAVLGYLCRRLRVGGSRVLYLPFYFCLANIASAVAVAQLCIGRRIERWEPQRHPVVRRRQA